jgi:amino acid permease
MSEIAADVKGPGVVADYASSDEQKGTVENADNTLEYAGEPESMHRGYLHRNFKARHVQMIALGANIGSGVLISSGKVSGRVLIHHVLDFKC